MDDIKLIDGIKKQDIEYLYKFIDKYGKIIYSVLNNILDRYHEKKIFILRYLNGENIDFISNETKIPKANVYNRLSRGRKKLKNIMEGNIYEKK